MVTTLKMIGKVCDWIISATLTGLFVMWLFGFVKVYSLFGKFFLVIG
jgi:hypothetical protein